MKKAFAFIFSISLLFACNQKQEKKPDEKIEEPAPTVAAVSTVNKYAVFIKALDTSNITSISAAAKEYERLFQKADSIQSDSGYVLFNALYDKILSAVNEQHIKDPTDYSAYVEDFRSSKAKKSAKSDVYVKKLQDNGFTLITAEGSTYIKQNRNFLATYFYPRVSSVMKKYLEQVNKESVEGFTSDAGLVITPLQLSHRVLWWENFLKDHPTFVFNGDVQQKQRGNLTFLLEGIDNTPLVDYQSKKLSANYSQAFEHVLQNNPQSSTAALIKPYYEALKNNDKKTVTQLLKQYKKKGIIYDYSA